jgi:hypothetical protein
MHENVSDDCIRSDHLFKGGYFNGKAPSPKGVKLHGKSTAPNKTVKGSNMFIYSPSIKGCPKGGVRLAYDNQLEQPLTIRRVEPYDNVRVPNNVVFTASTLFNPASTNTKFPPSFKREEARLVTALNASRMTIKDLLPIAPEEAEVDDDEGEEEEKPGPAKPRIKYELVEQCLFHMAEAHCELKNAMGEYPQYATISGVDSPSSDGENRNKNSDGDDMDSCSDNEGQRLSNSLIPLWNYHNNIKEVFGDSQDAFRGFADLLQLKNADSCRSLHLSRKCLEIQTTGGRPSAYLINGYLQLAAKTVQSPQIIYSTHLKLKHLNKIVESMGFEWEDGYMISASEKQIDAEKIEKGICSVQFKTVGNRAVSLADVLDAMEEGDKNNELNVYHAQLNWLKNGWTCNIEHLMETQKTLDGIKYLIWIEK